MESERPTEVSCPSPRVGLRGFAPPGIVSSRSCGSSSPEPRHDFVVVLQVVLGSGFFGDGEVPSQLSLSNWSSSLSGEAARTAVSQQEWNGRARAGTLERCSASLLASISLQIRSPHLNRATRGGRKCVRLQLSRRASFPVFLPDRPTSPLSRAGFRLASRRWRV